MYKSIQSCINEIFLMEDEVKRREFIKKQHGDKLSDNDIDKAIEHDPSKNKAYAPWIARGIAKKHIAHEDLPVVNKTLEQFHTSKHTLEPADRDLNRYKSHRELHAKLNPNVSTGGVETTPEDQKYLNKKEAALIHHDNDSRVIIPLTDAAAKHFGKGTSWCTTEGAFKTYHRPDDPLYTIHHKGGFKHQIHFGSYQHMDPNDEPVEDKKLKNLPATQAAEKHYRSLDKISNEHPDQRHFNTLMTLSNAIENPEKHPEARKILFNHPNIAAKYFANPDEITPLPPPASKEMHEHIMRHADQYLDGYLGSEHFITVEKNKSDNKKNRINLLNDYAGISNRIVNSLQNIKDPSSKALRIEHIQRILSSPATGLYNPTLHKKIIHDTSLKQNILNNYKKYKEGKLQGDHALIAGSNMYRLSDSVNQPDRDIEETLKSHPTSQYINSYLEASEKYIWPEMEHEIAKDPRDASKYLNHNVEMHNRKMKNYGQPKYVPSKHIYNAIKNK